MSAQESTVIVGRVVSAYGVKGWVKVKSFTDPPENVLRYQPWIVSKRGQQRQLDVVESGTQGEMFLVHLRGVDGRDEADRLRGAEIAVARGQLPPPAAGEYYWTDLIGLRVETQQGQELGQVEKLLETGANDVLVVKGERERLIPFIQPSVIRSVDLSARRIIVDWDPDF